MAKPIEVSEINKTIEVSTKTLINNEIKITNTSSHYVNNLKILVKDNELSIIEQSIIRQRGALDYEPSTHCLEVGNLAPDETAYFEYKFTPSNNASSLVAHLTLCYKLETNNIETKQDFKELITPLAIPN